jgi:hypothetical protein
MSVITLSDFVEDAHYNRRGRVTAVHFGCPEGAAWLMGQERQAPAEGRWLSVLVDGGGSIAVHESALTKVEPFELDNTWADFYWPEVVKR